jgi:predicted ATPase
MSRKTTTLSPPFLKRIREKESVAINRDQYPFDTSLFGGDVLDIEINKAVCIIVGENGTGKSTLLEAIAYNCGFSAQGGNKNHNLGQNDSDVLSDKLIFSWIPKINNGFFLRAETLHSFILDIDKMARETGDDIYNSYGGKSLDKQSHGEAFISIFENRFGRSGIYILDEPEAALSPSRQLEFLKIIKNMEDSGISQVIIATHSPLIMAYPGAQLMKISESGVSHTTLEDTPHFRFLQTFYDDPRTFIERSLN